MERPWPDRVRLSSENTNEAAAEWYSCRSSDVDAAIYELDECEFRNISQMAGRCLSTFTSTGAVAQLFAERAGLSVQTYYLQLSVC
jgi:hypothetical protein